ncbi:hypothetical protein GXW83_15805 [Streptacidiphilus sp. PB12-B1b]|uniref:hypothetical protein n=1 Tax=Streptacidiphilus sp. PB12-B1b TaxID=2705012 RepID=UPI0015FE4DE8|nr:hypothetical protein [Streptacidiphilus sp. PB12-B1b]QMU76958.1 hypothetical protein GXW83_15805 [Streptacidiphilus sp. PB12-B1b]
MRLRHAAVAAAAAFALALSLPGQAMAADSAHGDFLYQYKDIVGVTQVGRLVDPDTRVCINLPEVLPEGMTSAFHPENQTDATATVWTGADCTGDYTTMNPFTTLPDSQLLRSVIFS